MGCVRVWIRVVHNVGVCVCVVFPTAEFVCVCYVCALCVVVPSESLLQAKSRTASKRGAIPLDSDSDDESEAVGSVPVVATGTPTAEQRAVAVRYTAPYECVSSVRSLRSLTHCSPAGVCVCARRRHGMCVSHSVRL